jgi:glycosyltransferase involved in cell wall biosynthesis
MRVALTVHKFPPDSLGGTEVYTWGVARALVRAGHAVNVFYPLAGAPHPQMPEVQDGVRLWRVPVNPARVGENPAGQFWHTFRDAGIEKSFTAFLAETEPDLVHFQHVQGVSARLIELAAGRRSPSGGRPCVITLHDYWFFCANSQLVRPDRAMCAGPQRGRNCVDCATARADLNWLRTLRPLVALPLDYRNRYLAGMAAQADLLIAPSDFLREQYVGQGFPAGRLVTIENGVEMSRLAGAAPLVIPHDPDRVRFGFLGSLAWQKGVHVLVEAFNRLPPNAMLTVYGSDRAFPEYGAEVRSLARHPGIQFAGALDYQSVGDALRALDCLIVPSLWYENSPLVIQEAFAVGLPVIASRLGALTEKVEDGVTGRLFEPGSVEDLARVLGELIEEPAQLHAYAGNVRPAPSMDAHAEQLAGIYRRLLDGAAPL